MRYLNQKCAAHLEADVCLPQTYKIIFGGELSLLFMYSNTSYLDHILRMP
jgi:hypothetical protein